MPLSWAGLLGSGNSKKKNQSGHLSDLSRVPTEIQKHNSMIFHDQQCNFYDYLMHNLQPSLLAAFSPR